MNRPRALSPLEAREAIDRLVENPAALRLTSHMSNATHRPPRRCYECGGRLRLQSGTIEYPESGLDHVVLTNVPIWRCRNGHDEVEIPAVEELHTLLAESVIRKRTPLVGAEVRFLRKRLGMTAQQFAARLAMTSVHLSRLENGRRPMQAQVDLLVRLFCEHALAAMMNRPCRPEVVSPILDKLEASEPETTERRFSHRRPSGRSSTRPGWTESVG